MRLFFSVMTLGRDSGPQWVWQKTELKTFIYIFVENHIAKLGTKESKNNIIWHSPVVWDAVLFPSFDISYLSIRFCVWKLLFFPLPFSVLFSTTTTTKSWWNSVLSHIKQKDKDFFEQQTCGFFLSINFKKWNLWLFKESSLFDKFSRLFKNILRLNLQIGLVSISNFIGRCSTFITCLDL